MWLKVRNHGGETVTTIVVRAEMGGGAVVVWEGTVGSAVGVGA